MPTRWSINIGETQVSICKNVRVGGHNFLDSFFGFFQRCDFSPCRPARTWSFAALCQLISLLKSHHATPVDFTLILRSPPLPG
jgi:hypothetical protein